MDYTVVVVTEGNDPPGLAYIAPYAATSIAEHFMEEGRDVLIVYDDLTSTRVLIASFPSAAPPPGREAFPAISFTSTRGFWSVPRISAGFNGGSLAALPIIETGAEHFRLHSDESHLHHGRPDLPLADAVRAGRYSRRRRRQVRLTRRRQGTTGGLPSGGRRSQARLRAVPELETFAKFGTRLDDHTRKIIDHGLRIRAVLKQPELEPASVPEQIVVLVALTGGCLDCVPIDKVRDAEQALRKAAADLPAEVRRHVRRTTS